MYIKKSSINGVAHMKGIEHFLPEDIKMINLQISITQEILRVNEDQVYELKEDSSKENIQEEKKVKEGLIQLQQYRQM